MRHTGGSLSLARGWGFWKTPLGDVLEGPWEDVLSQAEEQTYGQADILICAHPLDPLLGLENDRRLRFANLFELFLFTEGTSPPVPSAASFLRAIGKEPTGGPDGLEYLEEALLSRLQNQAGTLKAIKTIWAHLLHTKGWAFGSLVLESLQRGEGPKIPAGDPAGSPLAFGLLTERLAVWENRFSSVPKTRGPSEEEVRRKLAELTAGGERRVAQENFSFLINRIFQKPAVSSQDPAKPQTPLLVLAEATTGVGKTLGYLAPAAVWGGENDAQVWISTYTHALQEQLLEAMKKLYPDPQALKTHVCLRKGQESYVCLLNVESALAHHWEWGLEETFSAVGLLSWLVQSDQGDMQGRDFPHWLEAAEDIRRRRKKTGGSLMADVRNRYEECLHTRCSFYQKCFAKKVAAHSRAARFVIANHAMTLHLKSPRQGHGSLPSHVIFDEAHHLFSTAESFYAAQLSLQRFEKLHTYFVDEDSRHRRGFSRLLETIETPMPIKERLQQLRRAAGRLFVAPGFLGRTTATTAAETFFQSVRNLIVAQTSKTQWEEGYPLEAPLAPHREALAAGTRGFLQLLGAYRDVLDGLFKESKAWIGGEDFQQRTEPEAQEAFLSFLNLLDSWLEEAAGWQEILEPDGLQENLFMDRLFLERDPRTQYDVGLERLPIDPTRPLYDHFLSRLTGLALVSATLTDGDPKLWREEPENLTETEKEDLLWRGALQMTGAAHHPFEVFRGRFVGDFDYEHRTRVCMITDLRKNPPPHKDGANLNEAFFRLFLAAGGGGLGVFTSVRRLRGVAKALKPKLRQEGITLWAQHADSAKTHVLVDLFRADPSSCILGADSLRDGIDIPGKSLKIVIFEKVPWSRRSLIQKAREDYWKKHYRIDYEGRLVRGRLKQGFGRLIRRSTDYGLCVILTSCPSQFLSAFPAKSPLEKRSFLEAQEMTRQFFEDFS